MKRSWNMVMTRIMEHCEGVCLVLEVTDKTKIVFRKLVESKIGLNI